jgi:iron complex transport system substrate-binding protein
MDARPKKLMALVALLLVWVGAPEAGLSASFQQRTPAKRIVSLVPALTEILFAIGAGSQVIAVSNFDEHPSEVSKLPKIGALLDPDTERILSMRPDLVMVYGSQDTLKAQLARAGIATFDYRHGGLADIMPVFERLGELTGHQEGARKRVHELESKLAAVRTRVDGLPRPKTLLVMGREPRTLRNLDASGGVGFLHDLLVLAGGSNVFGDVKRQAVRASTEMLLARAPEVIVDLQYANAASEQQASAEVETWRRLGSIPAVQRGRIHVIYGDHTVVPGPRIGEAAEALARAIHPEAF